ncbi:MAG: insulinase family protein [Chitinophagales bacterium]|nr:insulinase family protein [Chitinophagales bacterium]
MQIKHTPPIIKALNAPVFKLPESYILSNDIQVWGFHDDSQEITRIEIVLDSGKWEESVPEMSHGVAKLFKSGTNSLSAFQMSASIDHLGSTIKAYAGYHGFTIVLYTLRKNILPSLELLNDCLQDNIFPESEFENYIRNTLSKLLIQEEKTEFLAEKTFRNALFGPVHPYGYSPDKQWIDRLTLQEIKDYFLNQVQNKKPTIYISGSYDNNEIQILEQIFGQKEYSDSSSARQHIVKSSSQQIFEVYKSGSVQSSLIVGKRSINKTHPDFARLSLTNVIFGGYFGSRLMLNIREEKGYTYGIYSALQTYRHDANIFIQTETSNEYIRPCIEEIKIEINKLQQELISDSELSQAKNYLLGKYLSRMDGAFSQMETFKNYQIEGLNILSFNNFAKTIQAVTKQDIIEMAQKYLGFEDMYQVTAGS